MRVTVKVVIAAVAVCARLAQGQVMADGRLAPSIAVTPGQPDEYIFGFSPSGTQQLILNGNTIVNASNTGWYDNNGTHSSFNANYIAGICCGPLDHRDFFVFFVPNLGTITSATLSIGNSANGYVSPRSSDTYRVFDVSTSIATLVANQAGRVDIFNDLGTGTLYASRSVDATTDGTQVQIPLNASAIAALNSAQGTQFAFGGALPPPLPPPTIPVPPTLLLTVLALAGMGISYSWRKNQVRVQ